MLRIFLLTTASRQAVGPIQSAIQWIPWAVSLGAKRQRRDADHPPPSSAEVKNEWSYTSTPQYAFMAWCSVKRSTGTALPFTFILPHYAIVSNLLSLPRSEVIIFPLSPIQNCSFVQSHGILYPFRWVTGRQKTLN